MTFRLPLIALGVAALSSVALVGSVSRGDAAKPSLGEVERKAEQARRREQVLTGDVTRLNDKIRAVEVRLAPVQARWTALNAELTSLQTRRRQLTDEVNAQQARLDKLNALLKKKQQILGRRLSAAYRSGRPSTLQVLLQSRDLSAVAAVREAIDRAAAQDRDLIVETKTTAEDTRRTKERLRLARNEVYATEQKVAVKEGEARKAFQVVAVERDRLVAARGARRALLSQVSEDRREFEAEARDLRARSAALAATIRAGSANLPSSVAVTGNGRFAWPVNGPITSSFGPRWGRMHEGIDIGAGTGTPIGSAGPGTVIVAGWVGGYGNMVVVAHGNAVSTAYAHMSRIAASVGQSVSTGTVLGAIGCTGHCFGPHLHFEVRVNGSPRNPVAYL